MFYHNPDGSNAWTTISASPGGLVSNAISDVGISGGLLWVGTNGYGISVLDLVNNTWSTYTTSNTDLPSNAINRITAIPSLPPDMKSSMQPRPTAPGIGLSIPQGPTTCPSWLVILSTTSPTR